MIINLSGLELAVLHEHIIGNNRDDEGKSDYKPDEKERIDDDSEESGGDAAAKTRSEACVDLGASGPSRQTAYNEQDDGQRAHDRRDDDYDGLYDPHRVPFEFDLEGRVEHLDGYRECSV